MDRHPGEDTCRHMTYQLTCDEMGALLTRSGGVCEICGRGMRKPYIDHDHELGKWAVRGLLCPSCNVRLALRPGFLDEPEVVAYLANAFKTVRQVRVITKEDKGGSK